MVARLLPLVLGFALLWAGTGTARGLSIPVTAADGFVEEIPAAAFFARHPRNSLLSSVRTPPAGLPLPSANGYPELLPRGG